MPHDVGSQAKAEELYTFEHIMGNGLCRPALFCWTRNLYRFGCKNTYIYSIHYNYVQNGKKWVVYINVPTFCIQYAQYHQKICVYILIFYIDTESTFTLFACLCTLYTTFHNSITPYIYTRAHLYRRPWICIVH